MDSPRSPSVGTDSTTRDLSSLSTEGSNELNVTTVDLDIEVPVPMDSRIRPTRTKKKPKPSTLLSRHPKKVFFALLITSMVVIGALVVRGARLFLNSRVITSEPTVSIQPSNVPSEFPSTLPSFLPTIVRSESPSEIPTSTPSLNPSFKPSQTPSDLPSVLSSSFPSIEPSILSSSSPSAVISSSPSAVISSSPSSIPSSSPSLKSSPNPSTHPSMKPSLAPTTNYFDFYVFGDIPYNTREHDKMLYYVTKIPADANFIVHVGDINKAVRDGCPEKSYVVTHNILKACPVPLFITPGDNDWNDCPDPDEAWDFFMKYFEKFDQNWNHNLPVEYQPSRTENFSMYFDDRGILFIGLNLVGGLVHDTREWETRLLSQLEWTVELIEQYRDSLEYLVIFGHAVPINKHKIYFRGFDEYWEGSGLEGMPVLYIHGDGHEWEVEKNFRDHKNFLRIQVDDGADAPPIRIRIEKDADKAFQIDRRLEMSFDDEL